MFKKYHLNRMEAVADMIDSNMRFRYSPSMYRMLEAAKAVKK